MERGMLHKIKAIFREIWQDFKNPRLDNTAGSNCCGYDLHFDTSYLRPQPVKMKEFDNHPKKLK